VWRWTEGLFFRSRPQYAGVSSLLGALCHFHQGARLSGTASAFRQGLATFSLSLAWLSCLAVLTPSAHGQSLQQAEVEFDVPAQSLDGALEAYMQVTGLQVLYQSALTAGRFSTALKGRFTAPQALTRLLAGTRLSPRFTMEGAFTVLPVSIVQPEQIERRPAASYDSFLGNAQSRIITALCREAATRPGTYRAAVQLSIGQTGLISDASLLDTTGDQARDQTITSMLRGLAIGQAPPAGMPQPITMLVTPRAAESTNECQSFSR
jgi:secretin/TonB-like protein